MLYVVILLAGIVLFLAARLFLLGREIARLSGALAKLDAGRAGGTLTLSPLHKPLEQLCHQINVGLDMRDKARLSTENHEAALRAQISNISHDLRTPLTAILGYITLIRATPEKSAPYLDIIEERSRVLLALIEQFYELSVLEDSKEPLPLGPVDVTAALTHCLLGHYPLFEKKGIEPRSHLPGQAVMIAGNAQALERIFQNLIQNALKFANHEVSISLSDEGAYCAFTISNDAQSLGEGDMGHLFERFYTADAARTGGNTGLGLYIVTRLLEKTGGRIHDTRLVNGRFTLDIHFPKAV